MFNPFFRSLAFSIIALFIVCFALWETSYAMIPPQLQAAQSAMVNFISVRAHSALIILGA